MAIVSLSCFEPEELPGVPPWRLFPKGDVSNYGNIWTAVRNIANNCISEYATANTTLASPSLQFVSDTGWDAVGKPNPRFFQWPFEIKLSLTPMTTNR